MANVYNKPIIVLGGGEETPVDNGIIYEGKYRVRYFDIDGTVLKIEYVANGDKLTPPNNPNYDSNYLIFDSWNYDIENYIVERPTDVGALYATIDSATYIFCTFTAQSGLTARLLISNFTSIDWGDGTIDTSQTHTYEKEGEYIIKIYGDIQFETSGGVSVLGGNTTLAVRKIYLSQRITDVNKNAFSNFKLLDIISLSPNLLSLGDYALQQSNSITYISIPRNINKIGYFQFYFSSLLQNISLPEAIQTLDTQCFASCGLKQLILPPNITKIAGSVFQADVNVKDYIFTFKQIPVLENAQVFSSTNSIMWVNDDIIENLKVAANWSTYANRMKPLSWYPNLADPNA